MKISIATGPWLPAPAIQGGAIPRLWQGLAEEFAAKGHEVRIICRAYPGQPKTETINGVHYIRQGGFSQSTNIAFDLLKDLIYAASIFSTLPSADILVINDFWLPIFASLRPKAGKIVINAARVPKGQYRLYANAAKFVAVSCPIQQAIIQQYPAAASRTRVIHNPINTQVFCPPASPRIVKGNKTVLYVGRIHPEKGIHLLIEAFAFLTKQLPQAKLQIVGPVKESQGGGGVNYLNTLKRVAEGLPVEFSAPIFDPIKIAEIYQKADLFCYPSLAEKGEAFGVAPLEAMATGLVPIVSDLACFRDFIDEGKTGYFFNHRDPCPVEKLSETLLAALLNSVNIQKMSLQAWQKASNFSYPKIAELYLAIFTEILCKTNSSDCY